MIVNSPDAEKLMRFDYSGSIIDLTFGSGKKISVTPNHMLLTDKGFKTAQTITNADNIIDCTFLERFLLSDPKINYSPASISEVFIAASKSGKMSTASVPVTAKDFHNDGQSGNGDVSIISTDSLLRDCGDADFIQKVNNFFLNPTLPLTQTLSCDSNFTTMLVALALASDGIVGFDRIKTALSGSEFTPAEKLSLVTSAQDNARLLKSTHNRNPVTVELLGDLVRSFVGLVKFDNVVSSVTRDFVGHIYDVNSTSTLYSINGIIGSNCMCTLLPVFSE
jgi:hypothetical protein